MQNKYTESDLLIFQKEFKTENDCWSWMFKTRWPDGFACPRCQETKFYFIDKRKKFQCSKCSYQVSMTAQTIFHKSKTPLLKWFLLIYRMSSSKTGVSIAEMQRELGIKDYKTIWVMAHKIRKAMADRDEKYNLDGLIEIDESFFGPKGTGKRGRGSESKLLVIIAISTWINDKGKEQPGFARAYVAEDASSKTIEDVLTKIGTNEKDRNFFITKIKTDGWRSYDSASNNLDIEHQRFILKNPADATKYLPWVHRFISNAKSVFRGVHHGVSKKHLQMYLSEVCYRFNRRWWQRQLFHRLLNACLNTTAVTRKELMQ